MGVFKINIFLNVISLLSSLLLNAQTDTVKSQIYKWYNVEINNETGTGKMLLLEGSTTDLKNLQIYAEALMPGKSITVDNLKNNEETLIIIKEGNVNFKLNEEEKILIQGSVALVVPGDKYFVKNTGAANAAYYVFKYKSKSPPDSERGNKDGGSFTIDWNSLEFHPHGKGGIRNYFERATPMLKRTEMHVTTLNPGIKSHEPHTHRAAEIVLMISGNTQMQIGETFYDGSDGDLYFLGSNVPHAIENTGNESCMYFAFQFE